MLFLIHPYGGQLTKAFSLSAGGCSYVEHRAKLRKLFLHEWVEINDLPSLSTLLLDFESYSDRMIIRGSPRGGVGEFINRSHTGVGAHIQPSPARWLCVDIDDLEFPLGLEDFNRYPSELAHYAAQQLPPEFHGVDFHYQFSSSMGIKPGIRIHLWYWLDRLISDNEAKAWLASEPHKVDLSLYTPVQPHFTAAPVFDPPEADPVRVRSGLYEHGEDRTEVPVPHDLEMRVSQLAKASARANRHVIGDVIEHQEIERNAETGRVIDGRERFLFLKSIDAAKELTRGKDLQKETPSVDALAAKTWELFTAEADLSDDRWTYQDALEKARYRHEQILYGWKPNGRSETTSLLPDIEPYFDLECVTATEGREILDRHLHSFFTSALEGTTPKRMALRVTMGAGKTTATINHLQETFEANPNLKVEFYLPRHDLIRELIPNLGGYPELVDIIHVRGRGETDGEGPEPCQRYDYVQALEQSGYSIRPNACWRSDTEKCDFYDDCAYWRAFRDDPLKSGALRLLPHQYLSLGRREKTPEPNIVIIDEAFLPAIRQQYQLSSEDVRTLFNDTTNDHAGNVIVDALRERVPLLKALRDNGIPKEWLETLDFDPIAEPIAFNKTSNQAVHNLNSGSQKKARFAEALRRTLIEEMGIQGREDVSRLRFDPRDNTVVIDRLELPEIPENTHVLILDATADEALMEHLFGEIEFHRIDIQQQAVVTQVYDRSGSNLSWENDEDKTEDLQAVLNENAALGDSVLCVSHKALADRLRETNTSEQLKFEHFGNLRGIDAYKDCQTIFITGRNQPPQAEVDGLARAVWWDDETPLKHDEAALVGAAPETNLPIEPRGYLLTNPDGQAGVNVRSFSDPRVEIIHQQIRESETVQAIARLRLVHAQRPKSIYLLGNLPIEMPVDYLVEWTELMPNAAERELIGKGNIPLTPTGWLKMRPDLVVNKEQAKKANQRWGVREESKFLRSSPLMLRMNAMVLSFKPLVEGKPEGRTQHHMFRIPMKQGDYADGVWSGNIQIGDWLRYLTYGDPDIAGSGWGPIKLVKHRWVEAPEQLIPLNEPEDEGPATE